MKADEANSDDTVAGTNVRSLVSEDLARVVEITNWATAHTAANLRAEPETVEDWNRRWSRDRERYPWLVAEIGGVIAGFVVGLEFANR